MPAFALSDSQFSWKGEVPLTTQLLSSIAALISAGLTLSIAIVVIRRRSVRSKLPPIRGSSTMADDGRDKSDHSPVRQQRLYHHFPVHRDNTEGSPRSQSSTEEFPADVRSAGSQERTPVSREAVAGLGPQHVGGGFWNAPEASTSHPIGKPPVAAPMPRFTMARPPPPPPLTPPEPSSAIFNLVDDRQRSHHSEVGTSFFAEPNPDYSNPAMPAGMARSTGPTTSGPASVTQSPTTPKRRSYTKTIPIGVPRAASSSRSGFDGADATRSGPSSSYPPTSPLLPGPPPNYESGVEPGYDGPQREIEVQGEIISVLDDAGAGWKRHTRVYGGGVCLACAASGGDGHHGGFYGGNVREEEKR